MELVSDIQTCVTGKDLSKFPDVIQTLIEVKLAYAAVNMRFGLIEESAAGHLIQAAETILDHPERLPPIEMWSPDLTVANRAVGTALTQLSQEPECVVNCMQSTVDVSQTVQTAVLRRRLSALAESLDLLQTTLEAKAKEFAHCVRLGRMHMNEGPFGTWGQVFGALALAVKRCQRRLKTHEQDFETIAAGTRVFETVINPVDDYSLALAQEISDRLRLPLHAAFCENEAVPKSAVTDCSIGNETYVSLAGELKAIALTMVRIGSGFFIHGSGPKAGLAEISLPAIAPGSTIMPGKINPSMAHLMFQLSEFVAVNEQMVSCAANELDFDYTNQMGGAFVTLAETLEILAKGIRKFNELCLSGVKVLEASNAEHVRQSPSGLCVIRGMFGEAAARKVAEKMSAGLDLPAACAAQGLLVGETSQILDPQRLAQEGLSVQDIVAIKHNAACAVNCR